MKTTIKKPKKQSLTIKKPKTMAKKAVKKSAGKSANSNRMAVIQTEAKKIWAEGKTKKYSDAVAKACKNLKARGEM